MLPAAAACYCCPLFPRCGSLPDSEMPFGGAGGQFVAERGSPASALPAGRVLARARFPLAGMCQHPWELGDVTRWAGAEALCGASLCLRCPVPAGQTPPKPPLLLPARGLGEMVRGTVPAGRPELQHPWGSPARRGPGSGGEGEGREGLAPEIRLCWDRACCARSPPPRSQEHEVPAGPGSANVFAGGIGFGLPRLSPAPWQPRAGLYFS